MTLNVGLLNFSENDRTKDHLDSIQELLDYARVADELGYSRFWLSEHYNFQLPQTWNNPDMLLPLVCANTNDIHVGIAGSLIVKHNALDIAFNYKLLSGIFPDRIDLGFARGAPGLSNPGNIPAEDAYFKDQAREITSLLANERENFEHGLVIPPLLGQLPAIWLLSLSYRNLEFALEIGANVSRSLFHKRRIDAFDTDLLKEFRTGFEAKYGVKPKINIAVAGCCHANRRTARKITQQLLNDESFVFDDSEIISAEPSEFYDRLCFLKENYDADEITLLQMYENHVDRLKGIELLAEKLNF